MTVDDDGDDNEYHYHERRTDTRPAVLTATGARVCNDQSESSTCLTFRLLVLGVAPSAITEVFMYPKLPQQAASPEILTSAPTTTPNIKKTLRGFSRLSARQRPSLAFRVFHTTASWSPAIRPRSAGAGRYSPKGQVDSGTRHAGGKGHAISAPRCSSSAGEVTAHRHRAARRTTRGGSSSAN
ncbi:hypothetical protein AAFF_G00341590 [Aldrovandia affinis]|uniref:Uncharacterized protein n=1 Tax=Aldrovandia affinis TaxID=143900 RepID=A0AAD7SKP7_9TELE|nr:hypothetical protein AAFF_G00341590 [Aldrovandia affinis]